MPFDYKCYAPDINIMFEIYMMSFVAMLYFVTYYLVMRKYDKKINGQVKKLLKVFSALQIANILYLVIMTIWE